MKKLLIVTQKVDRNDSNLGFFHRWIEEFANYADITVIASFIGEHHLPSNVRINSLGKERGVSRIARIFNFWKLFARHLLDADTVFFHMIPEFVVAAIPILVFRKCKKALWYVHGSVPIWLRIAEKFVDVIFTTNPACFRLPSKKVVYTGHAIDTEFFKPAPMPSETLRLMTAGRESPIKHTDIIRAAISELHSTFRQKVEFDAYANIPYSKMPDMYHAHDMFLSMSATGSVDKAVLEAMACGLTVITANEAFRDILSARYFLPIRDPKLLAERIAELADEPRPNFGLRAIVERNHSLPNTIQKIIARLLS